MKKAIFLLIVLIPAISCQQTKQTGQTAEEYQAEVKEKIAQFNKLYFEAWENEDLDSTLFFLDEGFINMFSFGPSQTKEECREGFKNVFDMYSIVEVEYESVELIADQNYAFETGFFKQKWISNDKQDTVLFDMRGISVFKKQEDGGWKMFRLVGQQ
ncbi:nuclear transport factor 2 family protein [bacterium]|nr:nuclear transport factor 2 family protein [bacterium]